MKIKTKILIGMSTLSLPLGFLLFSFIQTSSSQLDFSRSEIRGCQDIRPLIQGIHSRIRLNFTQEPDTTRLKNELFQSFSRFDDFPLRSGENLTIKKLDSPEIIQWAFEKMAAITDSSNLILDPDLDTYYLMNGTLLLIPKLQKTTLTLISKDLLTEEDLFILSQNVKELGLGELVHSWTVALREDQKFYGLDSNFQNQGPEEKNQSSKG